MAEEITQASQQVPHVPNRGRLARLSLEHKLPLIIGTLLLAVILALSAAAYAEVRASALRVASERLASITFQFRDLHQQSSAQLRAALLKAAGDDAIVRYAKTRDPRLRERALAALHAISTQPGDVMASELRDRSGVVLLSTLPPEFGVATMPANDVIPRNEPGDSAAIGRFRSLRDTIIYPIALAVRGTDDVYLLRWRRVAGTRRAREQMSRLIGSDASMFLGNTDGSQWSDLERPVAGPPVDRAAAAAAAQPIQSYRRGPGNERYLAAAAHIPGTPWLVVIDFPLSNVFAPVDHFATNLALIAFVALALGLLAAWIVSRQITRPLRDLTDAAGAVAGGDFSRRPLIQRSDELGRLGHAFSAMAAEVQQSREGLEKKVEQRTRDLNETLRQLHEAQDALVRREKLAFLGQLSSGVGHELRNPLGVMTNAVYYLKTVLTGAPKNVHEYLDILQQQITLSEKIVGDLLDFTRSKPPRRKPTFLGEATLSQLDRLGHGDNVRVDTEIPDSLPPVLVDPIQLGQIIFNLLTNASQALDGNGRITVRAHANGTGLHYEVSDDGPGIPKENLDKIFEPLFTTKARGIGLGLAVSRTLARANGGDLTLVSAPGKGATFRLTLPVVETATPVGAAGATS